ERDGVLRRPVVPGGCQHNAHMYYLLLENVARRTEFIGNLKQQGIQCVFHYVPLHSSPIGQRLARTSGELLVTNRIAEQLVRLPLWLGVDYHRVIAAACGEFARSERKLALHPV